MKKLFFFTLFGFFFVLSAAADRQAKVRLSESKTSATIESTFYKVIVHTGTIDNDGITPIFIECENLDILHPIVFFAQTYTEKELKRNPSVRIKYDRLFPGTRGRRLTDTCGVFLKDCLIKPLQKDTIAKAGVRDFETRTIRIPIYIAKYSRRKIVLMEKQVLELEIMLEDETFMRLKTKCDNLIRKTNALSFCPNPAHKPSLEDQEAPIKFEINSLKEEIREARKNRGLYDKHLDGPYNVLIKKLDAINFQKLEHDCGEHVSVTPPPPPSVSAKSCKFCNLTPQEIYHKLDDINKKIYTSDNRKAVKEEVMKDVELLYNCSKHSPAWKQSKYKDKIIKLYEKIKGY